VKTRVLEATVHGLDLALAVGRAPWATREGLEVTCAVLYGLLGDRPPEGIGWSAIEFVETATGRRRLTDRERARLGAPAEQFPLLS
jgi:hypothetical protein